MFSKEDKTREWNKLIECYISQHKYLRDVGKIWISQARSGNINPEVQTKLGETLTQTNKALTQLKNYFKPYLADSADVYAEDKLRTEVQNLTDENTKLKYENNDLLQSQEGRSSLDYSPDLLSKLSQMEEILEAERQLFNAEKKGLEEKVLQLKKHCDLLMQEIKILSSSNNRNEPSIAEMHNLNFRKKQQQFDDTLKAQNDLIEDLKQQLADSKKDREVLKMLNRNLETELQTKKYILHDSEFEYFDPKNNSDPKQITELNISDHNNHQIPAEYRHVEQYPENIQKIHEEESNNLLFRANIFQELDKNGTDISNLGIHDIDTLKVDRNIQKSSKLHIPNDQSQIPHETEANHEEALALTSNNHADM